MAKTGKSSRKNTPNASTLMPLALIGLGVILIIGVLIWQGAQSGGSSVTPVPTNIGLSIPEPGIQRVSLEAAKTAFDGGEAVFLDVRDADSYALGHIPGAINIPVGQLENRLKELEPDKEKWIITYCTWPNEESSARAARILVDAGFKRVEPILGGFEAWEKAGYPVK